MAPKGRQQVGQRLQVPGAEIGAVEPQFRAVHITVTAFCSNRLEALGLRLEALGLRLCAFLRQKQWV